MPGTDVRETRSTWMNPPRPVVMPTLSNARSTVLGTDPTVISACDPVTVRPSARVTTTPSPSRRTDSARACARISTPRSAKTSCSTAAASASSPGSTRSRLDTSVTWAPISTYADTNSAPVTPEPTTTKCSGSSVRSYSWRQVRMRSPSGLASSRTRGVAPVATSTTSAGRISLPPSTERASTACSPRALGSSANAAVPRMIAHALALDAGAHVGGLGHGEALDAGVDPREVDAHRVAVGGEAEVGRAAELDPAPRPMRSGSWTGHSRRARRRRPCRRVRRR